MTSLQPCERKGFLEQGTKCKKHKRKRDTFEYIEIKITSKTHMNKRKRQATDWKMHLLCVSPTMF